MNMYELSKEMQQINDQLITDEGEISPELETRLDQVNLALTEKSMGLRKWIASIDGNAMAVEAEISRLQKIKKLQDHLKERIRAYIKKNMELADKTKIETPIGTFTIAKNPASLEIVEPENIPDEYKEIIPEHLEITSDSKKRIKEAWENGYEVPGTKYISNKTNLRIK